MDKDGFVDEYNFRDTSLIFKGYSYIDFMMYCVLCGCDYYKLNKMGSKKAKHMIDKCLTSSDVQLKRVVWLLRELNRFAVGEDRKFGKAMLMFLKGQAFGYSFEDVF
jgi:hypothetical protein